MKFKPRNFGSFRLAFGASLFASCIICLSSSALAEDNTWLGNSSDWNDAANWDLNRVPVQPNGQTTGDDFDDAIVNHDDPDNYPVLTVDTIATPRDVMIGDGEGNSGRVDNLSGVHTYGGWFFMGRHGGSATYNLADVSGSGGTYTGMGQGSGSIEGAGRIWVGGTWADEGGDGSAVLNVHTTGEINSGDIAVGSAGSVGVLNMDSGTINSVGWNFIGKDEGLAGGDGTFNMSGGVVNNGIRTHVGESGTTGLLNLTGGSYHNGNRFIVGGEGGIGTVNINHVDSTLTVGEELQIGDGLGALGDLNLEEGTVVVQSYLALGRRHGTGILNMTGGTLTKEGNNVVTIGTGSYGSGTLNQSGGVFNSLNWTVFLGEDWDGYSDGAGSGNGTWNLSGTGVANLAEVIIGRGGVANGTFNLQAGGTLNVRKIRGDSSGHKEFNFDGGVLKPTQSEEEFFHSLTVANVNEGGAIIDTNGFNVQIAQALVANSSDGGLTKRGEGTLFLHGANTYTGTTTVEAGTLGLTTRSTGGGDMVIEDGAHLIVVQTGNDETILVENLTFGSGGGSSIYLDLGDFSGNPTTPMLSVAGTLTMSGDVTINISDALPAIGAAPLISYDTKSGPGEFIVTGLPAGMVATLQDDGAGTVFLDIESVFWPRWRGTTDDIVPESTWDLGVTENWLDLLTNEPAAYTDPSPVLFDDDPSVLTSTVTLSSTVEPSSVTFNNNSLAYFLTGTGKISGEGSLIKKGSAGLTLRTINDYTGPTVLEGGTVKVRSLGSGGVASSIGASSADASNLVIGNSTLDYIGDTDVVTDRGISLSGNNAVINSDKNIVLSGEIVNSAQNTDFSKRGTGNLTLDYPGNLTLASGNGRARLDGGVITFDGNGTQEISVDGELWIGSQPNIPAEVVLNNTTLNVSSWIAQGRGNGDTNVTSSLHAIDSVISSRNFSTGHDAGLPNRSTQIVTLTDSSWQNTGNTFIAENGNATAEFTLEGDSVYEAIGRFNIAMRGGSSAIVTLKDSSSMIQRDGWVSIGTDSDGVGTLIVQDDATLSSENADFNVADVGTSQGTMTIKDNAHVSIGRVLLIGKNPDTVGVVNLDGGTLTAREIRENGFGGGDSTFNFNGGLLKAFDDNPNATLMQFIDLVTVGAGGAFIDTNGHNVSIEQSLEDGGGDAGLVKLGEGTLYLNGFHNYTGLTDVTEGTLAGNGDYYGSIRVAAGASLNPGIAEETGDIYADSVVFESGSTLVIDLDVDPDYVSAYDELDISGAELVLTSAPARSTYVIASYGTLTGTFAVEPALPAEYVIDYAYDDGFSSNNIAIVGPEMDSPYEDWAAANISDIDPEADASAEGDPDNDGRPNFMEFALDGNPLSSTADGKKVSAVAEIEDDSALVITLPVRVGAAFSGATEQVSEPIDGLVYRIQGSEDLEVWDQEVISEVTGDAKDAIESSKPALNPGWEYRTFRVAGNIGDKDSDFIRVVIELMDVE